MALKLNIGKEEQRAGIQSGTPAPVVSAVEGLPGGLLHAGYRHRAAPDLSQAVLGLVGRLALIAFTKDFPAQQEDLGVFHQTIGDGSGDGGVVEDVAPVGKGGVGSDQSAPFMAVASGDDLIEEIRSLLIQGKVS